ncbi:probable phosphoglycerate mutase [Albimonas donghaensis]|uniref:Probable phosphoglycerate mutase n=1 Tax=Albimonas donghaensis TaxID=356660 RepID=A0A1H3CAV3_9RHOB|nr:histidine phosphatase family protein [Albimonas donghaensis]SDX51028.1 probable phosphoglycerate mutase [Albimonas donghaensis]
MTVTEPAPFEIGLLRHFPTLWNEEGRLQGRTDIPLAPASRAALATLALPPRWRGLPVICSPLGRAVETAEALAAGAPIRLDDRLVEMHMGDWEGRIGADLLADPDCAYRPVEDWGWDFQPPGGETPAQVADRAGAVLAELSGPALIVCHRGVMRALLARATGWNYRGPETFRIKRASVHPVTMRGGRPDGAAKFERLVPR